MINIMRMLGNNEYPPDHIRLSEWTQLRVELTWIYEGQPLLRQGHHLIPGSSAWLLQRGRLKLAGQSAPIEADTPRWVFLPPGYGHHHFSGDAQILSLRFHAQWINGGELFEDDSPHCCRASHFPQLEQAARPLLELVQGTIHSQGIHLLHHKIDVSTFLHLQHLTFVWLNAYVRTRVHLGAQPLLPSDPADRVLQARRLIDQQPLHERSASKRVAATVGLSTSQLNRLFVAKYGLTPRQYAEQHRLEFAKQALQDPNLSIKQLAYKLDFKYPSHFSNWFHRHTGYYPTGFASERRQ